MHISSDFSNAQIKQFIIHKIGNRSRSEKLEPSQGESKKLSQEDESVLLTYLTHSMRSRKRKFRFYHSSDINLNEVYVYVVSSIEKKEGFIENSIKIASHLYDVTSHPNIKSGYLIVALLSGIEYNNKKKEALVISKVEMQEDFIEFSDQSSGVIANIRRGVNKRAPDKSAYIIQDKGESVVYLSDSAESDREYWVKSFLNVKPEVNSEVATKSYIKIAEDFLKSKAKYDLTSIERVEALGRFVDAIEDRIHFDEDDFLKACFRKDEVIDSFLEYKKQSEKKLGYEVPSKFEIDASVATKTADKIRAKIVLDDSFEIRFNHIRNHEGFEKLEKGWDEEKKMSYYKIYFVEEE